MLFSVVIENPCTAKFDTAGWDEKPIVEIAGSKLKITRVRSERVFGGEDNRLQGKGVAEYTMVYHESASADPHDATASYAGLMHFTGTLDGGEAGEVAFITTGVYDKGVDATWTVDPKTAKGGLKGLKGKGGYYTKGLSREVGVWLELDED
ncbi:hypothetical protein FRB94_007583 [Tulasnella sp. JGI-2019a]|nr:hypothetical protein FRB93_001218 [Tulasnella sp. JGI-2019a]KAG8997622.1 hypothetical protein FRB94_007583 [Tulasnella sp. JGI-2019a]KAG9028173.1 hypothetical protein FRB95_006789 [Tulasnella sp. JGI-2019a]